MTSSGWSSQTTFWLSIIIFSGLLLPLDIFPPLARVCCNVGCYCASSTFHVIICLLGWQCSLGLCNMVSHGIVCWCLEHFLRVNEHYPAAAWVLMDLIKELMSEKSTINTAQTLNTVIRKIWTLCCWIWPSIQTSMFSSIDTTLSETPRLLCWSELNTMVQIEGIRSVPNLPY